MNKSKNTEIKKATCHMCFWHCARQVHVRDGKPIKVAPWPDHPIQSQKPPCYKGAATLEFHDHPTRINYPLKRAGKRGENKWERISWDQALDEIAAKLLEIKKEHGPEAVFVNGGTVYGPAAWSGQRWSNIWGTPNYIYQGKNCGCVEVVVESSMYGEHTIFSPGLMNPEVNKCVLVWGTNPSDSLMGWEALVAAKKNGSKMIFIDPRTTESVKKLADEHLKIRPGTDGALALGMLNFIINEELYDKEFVRDWCLGFEQVREIAMKYPPKRASEITWIPEEQIISAARDYATLKPSICSFGVTTTQLGAGASLSAVLAKSVLRAIAGNLDVEGGHYIPENYPKDSIAWFENMYYDMLVDHPERRRDNVSSGEFPIGSVRAYKLHLEAQKKVNPRGTQIPFYWLGPAACSIWPAIVDEKPYPIKAMLTQSGNPMCTLGNSKEIVSALMSEKLDMHVCMDYVWTPTAQLADYVLPAADWLERCHIPLFWGHINYYTTGEQCIEPAYERRDDYQFWREIGNRVGQDGYWPDTLEGMYDRFLKPTGMTFSEVMAKPDPWNFAPMNFKKYEKTGFPTFSGKVELVPRVLTILGYSPKAMDFVEPARSPMSTPDIAKEYPLVLTSMGRVRVYQHSQFRGLKSLRKRYPSPLVWINPKDAAEFDISDGDIVFVETPEGRMRQKARVTEDMMPGVVSADVFWYLPELPGKYPCLHGVFESGYHNVVSNDPKVFNEIGEGYNRGLLCRVYKAKEGL